MRKKWMLATGMILVLGLSACQKSPDSSIVVNKDMDVLIDEARNGENGDVSVENVAQNYEIYQASFQDNTLGVTVNADAKVDIPQTGQMSVFRVAQEPVSQELLDKIRQELAPDTLYDGSVLAQRTRSEIEKNIRDLQAYYNSLEAEYEGEDLQIYQEETQHAINRYQEEYEAASADVNWQNFPSDGRIHTAAERYQEDKTNAFYTWYYDLYSNGELYYGVNDGTQDQCRSLYVQNDPERGNCIRYRSSKHGYEFISGLFSSDLEAVNGGGYAQAIWNTEGEIPLSILQQYPGYQFTEIQDEPVTISQEAAIQMADDFLARIGIEDFQYYDGGLYNEVLDLRYKPDVDGGVYRKEYILSYMRNIDGAFVTFDASGKHQEGWNGSDYVKKDWGIECMEFRINDSGIVGFDYFFPLTIVETVVEQSNMKTFEEVRSNFETMVTVVNATDLEENVSVSIDVDRVILGYARISEVDSYDTGLMVPVWDFKGKKTDSFGWNTTYGSIMTINAIDGSVIDREAGY